MEALIPSNQGLDYQDILNYECTLEASNNLSAIDTAEVWKEKRGIPIISPDGLLSAKSGVLFYNLKAPGMTQLRLWPPCAANSSKGKKLMAVMDVMNRKFGAYTLRPAVLFDDGKTSGAAIRLKCLSPARTTDWQVLPWVGCQSALTP